MSRENLFFSLYPADRSRKGPLFQLQLMRVGGWRLGWLSTLQMPTHYFHWGSGALGNVSTECLGSSGENPHPASPMPVHQVPNFTRLSKEGSVTVSATESGWIQSGEPRERRTSRDAHSQGDGQRDGGGAFSADMGFTAHVRETQPSFVFSPHGYAVKLRIPSPSSPILFDSLSASHSGFG